MSCSNMYIVMLWILFYYSLLLIAIIYFENFNIKIQYAANNRGVKVSHINYLLHTFFK